MNRDLERYLVLRELGRVTDPSLSRDEADSEQQRLETKLTGVEKSGIEQAQVQEGERDFIKVYFALPDADKADLPPEIHQWFLERIINLSEKEAIDAPDLNNHSQQLAALFFEINDPVNRFLVIQSLVNSTRAGDSIGVKTLWRHILEDKDLVQEQRNFALEELIRMLAELAIRDSGLDKPRVYVQLLGQMFSELHESPNAELKASAEQLRQIAKQVGGNLEAVLLSVLVGNDRRPDDDLI